MARKLAHDDDSETEETSLDRTHSAVTKELLNRREYIQLGAVASAAVFGAGAGLAGAQDGDGSGAAFTTDFSEYVQ